MTDIYEPLELKDKGAVWWHTDDDNGPNLSKASLGLFFLSVLASGAYIGDIYVLNHKYPRSCVIVSVFMTEEMKQEIEERTKFRFIPPPKIKINF